MTRIEFFVPGTPRPQTRQKFRVVQRRGAAGGKPGDYVPIPYGDHTKAEKQRIAAYFLKRNPATEESRLRFFGPVVLLVDAHFRVPKSLTKAERAARIWHTQKPDADNLLKLVKDALTGVAWKDDSQVVMSAACKVWDDENEGVGVTILQVAGIGEHVVEEWQAMTREVNLFLWHAGQDLMERLA